MTDFNMPKVFEFIKALDRNNNREWFTENKPQFLEVKADFENFIDFIASQLESIDPNFQHTQAKDYTFRIYRDVRFSKNKAPYKNHFGAYISTGGRKSLMPGYYIHIEPDASFVGGGVYMPPKEYLKAIRNEIYYGYQNFEKIVLEKDFNAYFPELMDDKLKNGPKDFPKDCDAIAWLKYKSFAVGHSLDDKQVVGENFAKDVLMGFNTLRPLNDFLNHAISENLSE